MRIYGLYLLALRAGCQLSSDAVFPHDLTDDLSLMFGSGVSECLRRARGLQNASDISLLSPVAVDAVEWRTPALANPCHHASARAAAAAGMVPVIQAAILH